MYTLPHLRPAGHMHWSSRSHTDVRKYAGGLELAESHQKPHQGVSGTMACGVPGPYIITHHTMIAPAAHKHLGDTACGLSVSGINVGTTSQNTKRYS